MQAESLIPQSSILGASPARSISNRSIINEGSKPKVLHSPSPNNGSENCDPNVVESCHKRKLKPSSKSDASARHVSPSKNDDRTKPPASDFSFLSPPRKVACNSRRFHSKNGENNAEPRPKSSLTSKRLALLTDDSKTNKCFRKKDPLGPLQEQNGDNQCRKCPENTSQRRWSSDDKPSTARSDSDGSAVVESAKSEDVTCYSSLKRASTDSVEEIYARQHIHRSKSPTDDRTVSKSKPVSDVAESEVQPLSEAPSDPEKENGEVTSPPNECGDVGTITPEKTANWRLTAVLQEFGNLTPTREGRVKTLVRAFEKLMTTSDNKEEQRDESETLKPRDFPLQFTYLGSVADGRTSNEADVGKEETELVGEEDDDNDDDNEQSKQSGVEGHSSSQTVEESGESSGSESVKRFTAPAVQQPRLHKFTVGRFASNAQGRKTSNRTRKVQGSKATVASVKRPPQKPQSQPIQVKPRPSKPNPFKLKTEERGHLKEQEFLTRLRQMVEEEEKMRIPLAQGLPWTTDEPEVPHKPPVKEITKPLDIHLNSDLRAMERAEFDQYISEKLLYLEQRRQEEERLRKLAEEQEIKKLRQEMVPKAQLMPYFDRPFRPKRSTKRPTIPKEPKFHLNSNNDL